MTKARTEGQKRRAKREGQREPNGRLQREPSTKRVDAARAAMVEARARRLGVWPADLVRAPGETDEQFSGRQQAREQMIKAATAYVLQPWMGCVAGRAIAGSPDVVALWQVITTIRESRAAYLKAICAKPDNPECIKLAVPSGDGDGEILEAVRPDLRTDEEKSDAAIDAWAELSEIFARIGPGAEAAIISMVILDVAVPGLRLPWVLGAVRRALDASGAI